jgi:hypothetical protein
VSLVVNPLSDFGHVSLAVLQARMSTNVFVDRCFAAGLGAFAPASVNLWLQLHQWWKISGSS